LQSELRLEDLGARYNSYVAAGHISVYNPVSVMSAFETSSIENFWVATGLPATIVLLNLLSNTIGEFPPLAREFSDDGLRVAQDLLAGNEIDFELTDSVTFSECALL
jgi:hypothetical protein